MRMDRNAQGVGDGAPSRGIELGQGRGSHDIGLQHTALLGIELLAYGLEFGFLAPGLTEP